MLQAYAHKVQEDITLAMNEMFGQPNDTAPNIGIPITAERRFGVKSNYD